MEHKEQAAQYLSGLADIKTERQTENALLCDKVFFESFIEAVEQRLYAAPAGLADAVMRLLPKNHAVDVTVPVLSRKQCAAVYFCSAAAILLLTVSGYDRYMIEFILGFDRLIIEFILTQSGRFNDWIATIQNFNMGGLF